MAIGDPWVNEANLPFSPEGQSDYDRAWLSPIMTIGGVSQVYLVDRGDTGSFYRYNIETDAYTELAIPLYNGQYCNRTLVPDDVDSPTVLYMIDEISGTAAGQRICKYTIATNTWSAGVTVPLWNEAWYLAGDTGLINGENVVGGTSGATARITRFWVTPARVELSLIGSGIGFTDGEVITGQTSGETGTVSPIYQSVKSAIFAIVHEDASTIYAWVGKDESATQTLSGIIYTKTSSIRCIKYNPTDDDWTIFSYTYQALELYGEMTGRCAAKNATDIYCGGVGVGNVEVEKYYSKYNLAGDSYTNHALTDISRMFAHSYDKDKLAFLQTGEAATERYGYLDTEDDSERNYIFPYNSDKVTGYSRICGVTNDWVDIIAYVRNTAPRLMSAGAVSLFTPFIPYAIII